jgi:hypothetical protein
MMLFSKLKRVVVRAFRHSMTFIHSTYIVGRGDFVITYVIIPELDREFMHSTNPRERDATTDVHTNVEE